MELNIWIAWKLFLDITLVWDFFFYPHFSIFERFQQKGTYFLGGTNCELLFSNRLKNMVLNYCETSIQSRQSDIFKCVCE